MNYQLQTHGPLPPEIAYHQSDNKSARCPNNQQRFRNVQAPSPLANSDL
jgi:hypothetical protein